MNTLRRSLAHLPVRSAVAALLLALLASCSVTLVSRYDPQIDHSATALQKKMDGFLTKLDTEPQPPYADSKPFYDDYTVELRSILVRAQSHPRNTQTEKQIELMIDNVEQLRALQQAGPVDSAVLQTTRAMFNQGWRAIITLEVAKQRGD